MPKPVVGFILLLLIQAVWVNPAPAEWPERSITLVSSVPETLPWSTEANPQAVLLRTLTPRLSRELGVPVNLVIKSEGHGVLAANMVAGANPDAYVVGALGPDQTMGRVIQGYTPYVWDELSAVAVAWREVSALVVRADFPARNLTDLSSSSDFPSPRLAYAGPGPLDVRSLMAVSAAKAAGFKWVIQPVSTLDPALLLLDQAEAMVLPLGWLNRHPEADKFRVLSLLVQDRYVPCAQNLPTLSDLETRTLESSTFAFYIPAQINWQTKSRLSTAINNALKQAAVARAMEAACLIPYREDLEGTEAVMNLEYQDLAGQLESLVSSNSGLRLE